MSSAQRMSKRFLARGFTLMELMVVVIIIGLLAALAIPSVVKAQDDRRAYNDAAAVSLLLRSARMRAIGRGAAVAVRFSANGTSDRGTVLAYEAVAVAPPTPNPDGGTAIPNDQSYPVSSCTATNWAVDANGAAPIARALFDGVNMNGTAEAAMDLQSAILRTPAGASAETLFWLCFTPTGRVFASTDTGGGPDFRTSVAFTALELCVVREPTSSPPTCTTQGAGPTRHVLVPPSGMARVFSQ